MTCAQQYHISPHGRISKIIHLSSQQFVLSKHDIIGKKKGKKKGTWVWLYQVMYNIYTNVKRTDSIHD